MKIFIVLQVENAPLRMKKGKKRWGLGGAEATKGVISSENKRKVIFVNN